MTDFQRISFIINTLQPIESGITQSQAGLFLDYYKLLSTSPVNVTAIKDFDEVVIKHFYDSIFPANYIKKNATQIIDVGTGGGFPGIPLAILYPHIQVVLLESVRKKVDFLNNCVDKLSLKNVSTIWGRAEDIAKDKSHRERYDMALSRALAPMNILTEYTLAFVRVGGVLLSYKSSVYEDELDASSTALKTLGADITSLGTDSYELPHNMGLRTIITVSKIKDTPSKYPRKSGLPKKSPL